MKGVRPSWLRSWDEPADPESATICFAHAGASASAFRDWRGVGANEHARHATYSVQLPGREDRYVEPPFRRICDIADHLADTWPFGRETEVMLFGHSMGALVSYELARRLEGRGHSMRGLVVSAHRAPHLPDPEEKIHALPRPDIVKALKHLAGTPDEFLENEQLIDVILPTIRADFEACETYEPPSAPELLACPVTAIGALGDPRVSLGEVLAWEPYASGSFTATFIPGDHFAIYCRTDVIRVGTG